MLFLQEDIKFILHLNNKIMLAVIAGIILVVFEIMFDKWFWKNNKPDKPISTIIRSAILILFGCLVLIISGDWYFALFATLSTAAVFFLLFDFTLNVTVWNKLPVPYYWRYHRVKRDYIKSGLNTKSAGEMAYINLTTWQRFVYQHQRFTKRFFWHGDEGTTSIYDKIFQRIPPLGELLLKGCVLYSVMYFYYQ